LLATRREEMRSFTEPSFHLCPHSTGRRMQTLTTPAATLANLKRLKNTTLYVRNFSAIPAESRDLLSIVYIIH
jgi:hypothetical protein